jgi:hypothetical protein
MDSFHIPPSLIQSNLDAPIGSIPALQCDSIQLSPSVVQSDLTSRQNKNYHVRGRLIKMEQARWSLLHLLRHPFKSVPLPTHHEDIRPPTHEYHARQDTIASDAFFAGVHQAASLKRL